MSETCVGKDHRTFVMGYDSQVLSLKVVEPLWWLSSWMKNGSFEGMQQFLNNCAFYLVKKHRPLCNRMAAWRVIDRVVVLVAIADCSLDTQSIGQSEIQII